MYSLNYKIKNKSDGYVLVSRAEKEILYTPEDDPNKRYEQRGLDTHGSDTEYDNQFWKVIPGTRSHSNCFLLENFSTRCRPFNNSDGKFGQVMNNKPRYDDQFWEYVYEEK